MWMCKSCQYLKLSVKLNSHVSHICFILTTCPQPGIRTGRRLWIPEDCDYETTMYCSCTADWPLGRPSCCSSLDKDSLSTLCFAALEKMKLSTATLALMSPLSAKWINVNKCYTKTMTFSYQSISTSYRKYYIPPVTWGVPCNYVSVFMDIIVSLLSLQDYTQKIHMETCAFKWWNSVCKCFPGLNMLESGAFQIKSNLFKSNQIGSWVLFYPGTSYFYGNNKSCRFFLHREASIGGELTKFCICSELCNLVVLQEKRRGQFCTCKSNCMQWCCSLASHTLTSIPSPSRSFSTWAQRSFILTLDC